MRRSNFPFTVQCLRQNYSSASDWGLLMQCCQTCPKAHGHWRDHRQRRHLLKVLDCLPVHAVCFLHLLLLFLHASYLCFPSLLSYFYITLSHCLFPWPFICGFGALILGPNFVTRDHNSKNKKKTERR